MKQIFFWQRFASVPKVLATYVTLVAADHRTPWTHGLKSYRKIILDSVCEKWKHLTANIRIYKWQVFLYYMHWKSFCYASLSVTHGSIKHRSSIIHEWPLVLEGYQISLGDYQTDSLKLFLQFLLSTYLRENLVCWESVSTALQLIAGSPYCTTSSVNRRGRAPVTMLRKKIKVKVCENLLQFLR